MEYDARGPLLKVLLLISGKTSRVGAPKALLRLPDGRLAFEHTLETLHSAVPSAAAIYLSFHDETHFQSFESPLREFIARNRAAEDADQMKHEHHHPEFPELKPIFDEQDEDIGPAVGLITAHLLHPDAKWLVMSCDYPLLPPPALQQLILEYQDPITCFVNDKGSAEPLIAIWDSEALKKLKKSLQGGTYELSSVVEEVKGRLIKPLREQWISSADTERERDEAKAVLASRK